MRGASIDYVEVTSVTGTGTTADPYIVTTDGRVSDMYLADLTLATSIADTKFAYNENVLGWYSYKIVVKQNEQEYYNVYSAGAMKEFLSPAGLILSLSALALVGAGIAAASKAATKTGDAILPASGGPIVSTMEGGIFQGTRYDDVLMGPGLARGGRNQGLSKGDIDLIANAVKQGASGAQINLDGARVSNRIQPPLAVNTRKYSV